DDIENVAFEARQISRIEPALAVDNLGGQVRCAIVTAHDVAAANVELTNLSAADRYVVERADSRLATGQQGSHRLVAARRVEADAGNTWCTFGDAVAIGKRQAQFLLDAGFQVKVERSTGDRNDAQRSAVQPCQPCDGLVFQQPLVGGRHAVQDGDALVGNRL